MKKALRRVGAIAVVSILALSTSGVAHADTTQQSFDPADCFSGHFCLWQDSYHTGTMGQYQVTSTCYTMGVMNNAASSIRNRSGFTVRVYDGSGCTGDYDDYTNGMQIGYLAISGWNDKITSFKRR